MLVSTSLISPWIVISSGYDGSLYAYVWTWWFWGDDDTVLIGSDALSWFDVICVFFFNYLALLSRLCLYFCCFRVSDSTPIISVYRQCSPFCVVMHVDIFVAYLLRVILRLRTGGVDCCGGISIILSNWHIVPCCLHLYSRTFFIPYLYLGTMVECFDVCIFEFGSARLPAVIRSRHLPAWGWSCSVISGPYCLIVSPLWRCFVYAHLFVHNKVYVSSLVRFFCLGDFDSIYRICSINWAVEVWTQSKFTYVCCCGNSQSA